MWVSGFGVAMKKDAAQGRPGKSDPRTHCLRARAPHSRNYNTSKRNTDLLESHSSWAGVGEGRQGLDVMSGLGYH